MSLEFIYCCFSHSDIGEGLKDQGSFFGGDHKDKGDLPFLLSCMVVSSDLPEGYESGRFHLLSIGVYVVLDQIRSVFFTGRLLHGGTPPLAPSGVEVIEDWAYRCVIIFYPASRIITGGVQTYMAASGVNGKGVTIPWEALGPK